MTWLEKINIKKVRVKAVTSRFDLRSRPQIVKFLISGEVKLLVDLNVEM